MTTHDAQHLVFEIGKLGYRFNDWEAGFIESIKMRIDNGTKLTPAQSDSLQAIYRKAAKGGMKENRQYI